MLLQMVMIVIMMMMMIMMFLCHILFGGHVNIANSFSGFFVISCHLPQHLDVTCLVTHRQSGNTLYEKVSHN